MKTPRKILLPNAISYREALIRNLLNILPRLTLSLVDGFWRQKNNYAKVVPILLLILYLLGYQPVVNFPPIKHSVASAEEQIQSVEAQSIPSFRLPHQGYISSNYSWYHTGIDIATSFDAEIKPIAKGVVTEVLYGYFGFGNHVIIDHGAGYKSLYGHMNQILVQKDQEVGQDDTIGTVGLTGFTSGPHTHLEVYKEGIAINPTQILPTMDDQPSPEDFVAVETPAFTPPLEEVIEPSSTSTSKKLAKTLKLDL